MNSTVQQALTLLEKLTGGATIVDNGVGICKNPNDAATTISNGAQITAVASVGWATRCPRGSMLC